MSYKELQKVDAEDLAVFFARLMSFYRETEEKSYLLFREDVIKSLRFLRSDYHEDLIDDIITRVTQQPLRPWIHRGLDCPEYRQGASVVKAGIFVDEIAWQNFGNGDKRGSVVLSQ